MNKWQMKIIQFMQGRYGSDQFNKGILIVSFVLYILSIFPYLHWLTLVSLLGFSYMIYRSLSKDIYKRSQENAQYNRFINLWKQKWKHRKTHKVFLCRECKRIVRVPRHKGKLEVKCPGCGTVRICHT